MRGRNLLRWAAACTAIIAAATLCVGCGGPAKRLVGTWELELEQPLPVGQEFSQTWTFRGDRTGTVKVTQNLTSEAPASQSMEFTWEVEEEQISIALAEVDQPMKINYQFEGDDALVLTPRGMTVGAAGGGMRWRRVR